MEASRSERVDPRHQGREPRRIDEGQLGGVYHQAFDAIGADDLLTKVVGLGRVEFANEFHNPHALVGVLQANLETTFLHRFPFLGTSPTLSCEVVEAS